MPVSLIVAIGAISVALPLLAWALLAGQDEVQVRTQSNLNRGFDGHVAAVQEQTGGLTSLARRLTPTGIVTRLERLLARAGRPPAWPVDRLMTAKLVLTLVAAGVSLLLVRSSPTALMVGIGIAVTVVVYFLPELLLHSRGQERSQKMALELPDTLDQMTIAVEAGLGFDSAMARSARNGKGPLAEELIRTLQDVQLGRSRRDAYLALAERANVPDLGRFVRAIVQADAYGISVADVLRTQAGEMRLKRRQRAEEKAMQIPVKVIFPLMLCILPVLFIVLLGPAVMDIVDAFSGGI